MLQYNQKQKVKYEFSIAAYTVLLSDITHPIWFYPKTVACRGHEFKVCIIICFARGKTVEYTIVEYVKVDD